MRPLDKADKTKLLRTMLLSRMGDLREQSLIRQGKGWFHVSGMGHEALSVVGHLLKDGDFFSGYYRDRPIALARGVASYELALAFFAKQASASGGRQMPAHYSDRKLGIFSIASVVGSSLLPACGLAWGVQLDGKPNAVVATVGDAGTRQGDFYESVALAREMRLPMLFIVEDNGIGISSVTRDINPLALEVIDRRHWQTVDGCDVDNVYAAVRPALDRIRAGEGPQFLWCRCERISSHSSADDHRKYRSEEELASLDDKDPLERLKRSVVADGHMRAEEVDALEKEITAQVRAEYERAAAELDPEPGDLLKHVFGPPAQPPALDIEMEDKARMVDALNRAFHTALRQSKDFVFFGQDIEDPKGGVFSLTKGLSTAAPERVRNSPLAESTILGVAVGLAAYGKRPVFEIQFADYLWPAFNQIATHFSTLHWRSNGEWSAPAVIYAPYGAYLPGGALWHSQANEAALAHFPGIHIAVPSTPEDTAGLFWSAMHGNSPAIILIPKHLMWKAQPVERSTAPVPFGKARLVREGDNLTIVSWGNCLEVVQEAMDVLGPDSSAEIIDLRSIAPLDFAAIRDSVQKTGRLLVVHEDARSCSVGQNIVSRVAEDADLFARLLAPPRLLAKPDVNIGYNPVFEFEALPTAKDVAAAVRDLLSARTTPRPAAAFEAAAPTRAAENPALRKMQESLSESDPSNESLEIIRVPLLGEGIASARLVSILAKAGETLEQDDALCEVETDKALFPVESPLEGTLKEWLVEEGDEVEVGQEIARVAVVQAEIREPAVKAHATDVRGKATADIRPTEGGLPPHIVAQLKNVVPAHMTVKAGWDAIRAARAAAKEALGNDAPTPTVMLAWALVQAMARHPVFTCTSSGDTLVTHREFDFGVAVSLDNDALDTAVIHRANTLGWDLFAEAYTDAVRNVRAGRGSSKAGTPLILTSMGGYAVRDALPVVVPPAIATLFVGESHRDTSGGEARDVVSLCLSFDHRWMNGVAAAQFLSDVRREMETLRYPAVRTAG